VTRTVIAIVGLMVVLGRATEAVGQAPPTVPSDRAVAQDRIRERFLRLLRERVRLSDDQLRRLAPVSRSFEARRQAMFREERAARQALRRELSAATADEARVAAQIDQLFALQRRRLDLAAEEQRELAAFMTPVQRARYLALQEHLRRRAEEMRRRRGDDPLRGGGGRRALGGPPRF
jgi:Spy/CpxP family protein refolding chaperone